jgi:hypothetical protein
MVQCGGNILLEELDGLRREMSDELLLCFRHGFCPLPRLLTR